MLFFIRVLYSLLIALCAAAVTLAFFRRYSFILDDWYKYIASSVPF